MPSAWWQAKHMNDVPQKMNLTLKKGCKSKEDKLLTLWYCPSMLPYADEACFNMKGTVKQLTNTLMPSTALN